MSFEPRNYGIHVAGSMHMTHCSSLTTQGSLNTRRCRRFFVRLCRLARRWRRGVRLTLESIECFGQLVCLEDDHFGSSDGAGSKGSVEDACVVAQEGQGILGGDRATDGPVVDHRMALIVLGSELDVDDLLTEGSDGYGD